MGQCSLALRPGAVLLKGHMFHLLLTGFPLSSFPTQCAGILVGICSTGMRAKPKLAFKLRKEAGKKHQTRKPLHVNIVIKLNFLIM